VTLDEINARLHSLRRLYHHLLNGGWHSALLEDGSEATPQNVARLVRKYEDKQLSLMEDMK
jgi:hypothetical protein